MNGFGSLVEIELDPSRFPNDEETRAVAEVVTVHAENRRKEYRLTEQPIQLGLLGDEAYWSKSVPWYEWMSEPQILQTCAEECGLKIYELANIVAYQIRPNNWQVFSWMGLALQGCEYEGVLTESLSKFTTALKDMRETSASEARSNLAKTGAQAKLAVDPKQRDKAVVRECWGKWQEQPGRYKGKAAFARDMRDKFPNLESQPVIEGWCRAWERET
jgi:3-mercaptopyruvate sulfurtransferase SseA